MWPRLPDPPDSVPAVGFLIVALLMFVMIAALMPRIETPGGDEPAITAPAQTEPPTNR